MHQLQSCGIAVELLRVKEPQEVTNQSEKVARKKSGKKAPKLGYGHASARRNPSSLIPNTAVIVISSDDNVLEKSVIALDQLLTNQIIKF